MKKILQANEKSIHAKQRESHNSIFEFNQNCLHQYLSQISKQCEQIIRRKNRCSFKQNIYLKRIQNFSEKRHRTSNYVATNFF